MHPSSLPLCRTRGDRQLKDGEVMYPVGYSDKPVPDTSVQEADRNLVEKVKPHNVWSEIMKLINAVCL